MGPVKLYSMYTRTTKLIQTNYTIGEFSYLFFHQCSRLSSEFSSNGIYTLSFHCANFGDPTVNNKTQTYKVFLHFQIYASLDGTSFKSGSAKLSRWLYLCKHQIFSKEYSKATTWAASENPGHIHVYTESSNNLSKFLLDIIFKELLICDSLQTQRLKMLHNLKNLPRRQIHLLKRTKRGNTLKISLICLKCWMDGSAVPVGWRGFTSDAEDIQKMPTSFSLQPWNASWLPPSNSMTQRPESHGSWRSTRHGCEDGGLHTALQTQRLLQSVIPHWLLLLCPTKEVGGRSRSYMACISPR